MHPLFGITALFLLAGIPLVKASSDVRGHVSTYTAPTGVEERCIALDHFPGGRYSESDIQQEKRFCSVDFYDNSTALCPKFFSTSPGILVYDISKGPYAGNPSGFEKHVCPRGKIMLKEASGPPISYKTTMNGRNTSGTFSTASLLYYHFSRYLDSNVEVPVSVWRSMDRKVHLKRVTEPGVRYSAHKKSLKMNHAAWLEMAQVEKNPASYHPVDELFTRDRKQIYGIFIHPHGKRYSAELNGTRRSGWGDGQNRDFQKTAPYLALRSSAPLLQAVDHGLKAARKNARLRKAMGSQVSKAQMVSWMQDLTEITLLDYIFSQQDRIGNIDYVDHWYWIRDGKLQHRPARGHSMPADIEAYSPFRIRRTVLNDNDAGGRLAYANYAKRTGMLEKIRHYNSKTYRRLMQLAADFGNKGSLYQYVKQTFGLSQRQLGMIVKNTRLAADILRKSCKAGKLRFDLDPETYLRTGAVRENRASCGG